MTRPRTILIAALGGEGGGVLSDWIVQAAAAEGWPVQGTSIPGVAQRTGATTYYIEIFPDRADAASATNAPVMALYPGPGNVDVMVASELIEAARALEAGYVTPDRTTLIASTHRVYSIAEKSAMADGRYHSEHVLRAARELSRHALLEDLDALAHRHGSVLNAVLLGAVAASDAVPVAPESFEAAIRASGVAVEANLRGFAAGLALARGETEAAPRQRGAARGEPSAAHMAARVREEFPAGSHEVLDAGVARLADYQDARYAAEYLARVATVVRVDAECGGERHGHALVRESARHLALWMSYEDVIRVADLKSRPERYQRVRHEAGAGDGEPVRITEFLKPGIAEVSDVLPPRLGRRVRAWARRSPLAGRLQISLRARSDSITGYLRLRLLARMKGRRRRTLRFEEEQARIERWLTAIIAGTRLDYRLALEICECARLLKGYSDTHERGRARFERIFEQVVEPVLAGAQPPAEAADRLAAAREAALADPEGASLERALAAGAGDGGDEETVTDHGAPAASGHGPAGAELRGGSTS